MTEKRQYCPKGHDTFAVGRDSSYRCLKCKREAGQAARDVRRAEEDAAQWARQVEINKELRRQHKERKRQIERLRRRHESTT
jgi:hypothetical protein